MFFKTKAEIDVTERISYIENYVYDELKKCGFRKHGRTLHRFVSGDISQVISFQCGQAYREETHLMWVNIGIRVPESFERTFTRSPLKKYYHEYECNIRSRLGQISPQHAYKETTYDLRKNMDKMAAQILEELVNEVLPVFDILSSRDMILQHRRDYPHFDRLNRHLIVLEEAMIYGSLGDLEKARELFELYYGEIAEKSKDPKNAHLKGHLSYLDGLAGKLGFRGSV